jgi:hypothetical protein
MKLLFIHRSVGQQMIDCVRTNQSFSELELYDFNANNNNLTNSTRSTIKGSPLSVLSGDTSPAGLAQFFRKAVTDKSVGEIFTKFDIIAFKSCYSANNIQSKEQLESYKKAYRGAISSYIAERPEKKFVIISPPPRKHLFSSSQSRKLAREFSTFLNVLSRERNNCYYFDLFRLLSEDDALAKQYCRRFIPWDQHPNSRGAQLAGNTMAGILKSILLK